MRRDGGCHAHSNALRAIGEQIGKSGGKNDRLFLIARIIFTKIDGIFIDAFEQHARGICHTRFGVAIGGGAIAVDIAEIALPLDHRIARGEILREAHQRIINRLVAVRMERTHHIADDLRAFFKGRARIQFQNMHAVENAAMHRLQTVTRIRQSAPHNGR